MTGNLRRVKNFIVDHKGFSLVEMIIVIAVMGILAGASLAMMGHIRYANTQKAAELISSELSKQQVRSMTKAKAEKPYVYVYALSDGYYMRTSTTNCSGFDSGVHNADGVKLCNFSTDIYSVTDSGEDKLDGSEVIKIVYNRSGSFSTETNVTGIKIDGTGTFNIKLITETGKHVVK